MLRFSTIYIITPKLGRVLADPARHRLAHGRRPWAFLCLLKGQKIMLHALGTSDVARQCVIKSNGCWLWLGPLNSKRYPKIVMNGKDYQVHRMLYEQLHGALAPRTQLDRTCGNVLCVNPEHIVLRRQTLPFVKKGTFKSGALSREDIDQHIIDGFLKRLGEIESTGCWLWTGYTDKEGYGHYGYRHGVRSFAHRLSYALFVGTIAANCVVDHTCNNRRCVNPQHLEVVTNEENVKRAKERRQGICKRGHQKTLDKHGVWRCSTCQKMWRQGLI